MYANLEQKLSDLAKLVTEQTQAELTRSGAGCESNIKHAVCNYKLGKKYARIDNWTSGKLMINMETGEIYGIKAYGVPHLGHYYGTLETTDQYFWGRYYPIRILINAGKKG